MKDPNIMYVDHLINHSKSCRAQTHLPDGSEVWVPARPVGYASIKHRIRAAWLVFTGQADAVLWRGGQ